MNWFSEHIVEIFSVLFGVGSIGFAVIDRVLNRKKYEQQVRQDTATADIHVDEFWKNRYDVLESEMKIKTNGGRKDMIIYIRNFKMNVNSAMILSIIFVQS